MCAGQLAVLQAEFHILAHGHVRENGVVLEHHANVALGGVQVIDALVIEIEIATLNAVETGDHAQKGGLTTAGGPQQSEKRTGLNVQRQIWNNGVVAILFHSMVDLNLNVHEFRPPFQ